MGSREVLFTGLVVVFLTSTTLFILQLDDDEVENSQVDFYAAGNSPILMGDGHDHRNASDHQHGTDNIEYLSFNPLTTSGNAEVQVARSPDGNVYSYQAGWNDMHIVDVTDPYNTTVMGVYNDPNTQVLDVKYIEHDGREFIIQQNQLIDPGNADPNVGEWSDPAQVSVTLIDVTDKSNPCYVDSWYDADHPSGPHNLFTHKIDNEWYIFVANPDYEQCDSALGEACGGVTIAHLDLDTAITTLGCSSTIPLTPPGLAIFKVGEAEVAWENTRGGWIYIHDMTVQTWPGTDQNDPRYGRTFIYGSYWEAGLRIFDVSDVPHPQNSPEQYAFHVSACKAGVGNPLMCRWRAPEVGSWMEFLDMDGDGQPDSQTTGNVNGGRVSYIHYAEPFPEMVDVSHLGKGDELRHYTTAAVEVLSTTEGTGILYLLDTTNYTLDDGHFQFSISLASDWEIPYAEEVCYGADCSLNPDGEEWLLFSPHNLDSAYFETNEETDASHGGGWDGRLYVSHYHAGLWVLDLETLIVTGTEGWTERHIESTVGWYLPHGVDGEPLASVSYEFGWVPFLWAVEHHEGRTYASCISTGLYIVQLDIDKPFIGQPV